MVARAVRIKTQNESDAYSANLLTHAAAIRLCLSNHLRTPALVLIYSGIDFVANLNRPTNQAEVTRSDFVAWAEQYMQCQKRLGLSGLDLYAARCGIVHTYTMDSRLSAQGKAKRILYAWGNRSPDGPMQTLKSLGFSEVMIKIEDLFSSYVDGVAAFCSALDDDAHLAALVEQRSRKLFIDRPDFPLLNASARTEKRQKSKARKS